MLQLLKNTSSHLASSTYEDTRLQPGPTTFNVYDGQTTKDSQSLRFLTTGSTGTVAHIRVFISDKSLLVLVPGVML